MLGRNHAALGVAAYGAAVWTGGHLFGLPALSAAQGALGAVVAVGAALAPDLDESRSLGGRDNPVSWLPIFGGHRRRTHWRWRRRPRHHGCVSGTGRRRRRRPRFCACTGGPVLSRRLARAGVWLCVPFGVALGEAVLRWVPAGWWLVAAVGLPYASHLAGDGVTPGGIPLFLPFSQRRVSLHLFRTGHAVERLVVTPTVAVLAVLAMAAAFSATASGPR